MAKKFNITGNCYPHLHYMADTSAKMRGVMALVEAGEYFTINRPRQFGKSSTMMALVNTLAASEGYLVFSMDFSGVGDEVFSDEQKMVGMFVRQLARYAQYYHPGLWPWLKEQSESVKNLEDMSDFITEFMYQTQRKVVLLIDEVDKSSNNQLFVSFLGTLRNKYLKREEPDNRTFHCIVLAGVHDVKTLKAKIRPGEEAKFNSPWNIATDFDVVMELLPDEIVPMLEDYMAESGATMDAPAIAERLFYFTSGYPFLVSKLCKMLAEDKIPGVSPLEWKTDDVDTAVKLLVKQNNTNFDSLINNLEDTPGLYDLAQMVLLNDEPVPFNNHDRLVRLGFAYGVFSPQAKEDGSLKMHNQVYQQVIGNHLSFKMFRAISHDTNGATYQGRYLLDDKQLDVPALLLAFQGFMREEHSKKDVQFLERQGRLIFLAFLKPILNGGGFALKEPQISEEKRLDLIITFFQHKYVLELKRWYGDKAHDKGLLQLADYLDRQGLGTGYLLIFDHTRKNLDRAQWLKAGGKDVYAVWV